MPFLSLSLGTTKNRFHETISVFANFHNYSEGCLIHGHNYKERLFSRVWPRIPKTFNYWKVFLFEKCFFVNYICVFLRTAGSCLITFFLDIEKVHSCQYLIKGQKNGKPTLKSHQAWNGPVCWIILWGLTKFRIHLILWLYAHSFSSSSHQINSRLTTFRSWNRVTL